MTEFLKHLNPLALGLLSFFGPLVLTCLSCVCFYVHKCIRDDCRCKVNITLYYNTNLIDIFHFRHRGFIANALLHINDDGRKKNVRKIICIFYK
jgi:hypothetical protein